MADPVVDTSIVSAGPLAAVLALVSSLALGLLALLKRTIDRAFGQTIPRVVSDFKEEQASLRAEHGARLDKLFETHADERREWRADLFAHLERERADRQRDRAEDLGIVREMTAAMKRVEDEVRRQKGS